ncbi:unnamed protein product [Rotaria sp. Silwood2]|nr:unnamed protein product [Rotaria sp. Silwood2]
MKENATSEQSSPIYYRRIFPSHIYCKWLVYGEPATCPQFAQREFSFTLENDVYRRYLSFSNHIEFEKELIKICPENIDIGASKDHKILSAAQFYPIERELVFDIDMTDYDDVRFCCRKIAANFFAIPYNQDGKDSTKRVTLYSPLHPSLHEFGGYACLEQDFLGDDQRIERFLRLVPDDSRQTLREAFTELSTSAERWAAFKQHTNAMINSATSTTKYRKAAYVTLIDEIMFEYCYPRLDANVTKGMNHLLKSPFTFHPKTGHISIPINLNSLRYFDPCKEGLVPKLNDLCQQTITKQKDYNQTSLKPFVDVFARFVQGLQTSKQDEVLAKSDLNTMLSGEI